MIVKKTYQNRTEWRNENNKLHRLDGPAVEYEDGGNQWWINGLRHRLDGPAIKYIATKHFGGLEMWYYEGKHINCNSQEEFERLIKMKAFW